MMLPIVAAVATAAVLPPPLVPPLAQDISYRTVERHPLSGGDAVTITSRQRLRFDRAPDGRLVATVTLDVVEVAAPPAPRRAVRAAAEALLGVPVRVALEPDGQPGAVLDVDAAWAAIERGYRSLDATLAADPGVAPADLAAARTAIAAERDRSPAARAARLQATIQQLLPPALIPLQPSESRPFTVPFLGSTGAAAAHGTLRLDAVADAALLYRMTIASSPGEGERREPARATLALDSEIVLDRATGLVDRLHERRTMRPADGGPASLIADREIVRGP